MSGRGRGDVEFEALVGPKAPCAADVQEGRHGSLNRASKYGSSWPHSTWRSNGMNLLQGHTVPIAIRL